MNIFKKQLKECRQKLSVLRREQQRLSRDDNAIFREAMAAPDPLEALRELALMRAIRPELKDAIAHFQLQERGLLAQIKNLPDYVT